MASIAWVGDENGQARPPALGGQVHTSQIRTAGRSRRRRLHRPYAAGDAAAAAKRGGIRDPTTWWDQGSRPMQRV